MVHMISNSGLDMWVSEDRVKEYEATGAKLAASPLSSPAGPITAESKPAAKTTKSRTTKAKKTAKE